MTQIEKEKKIPKIKKIFLWNRKCAKDTDTIAVITAEPAMQFSFCFGIIQARLSGQYNAFHLIYISFACSHNNCH